MEDAYVYISVKLYLKDCQSEDSINEIVQEMDYSFTHDDILEHRIVDILDFQTSDDSEEKQVSLFCDSYSEKVDPFELRED